MGSVTTGNVTLIGDAAGYHPGTFAQAGGELHELKLDFEPEIRRPGKNYQDHVVRHAVGLTKLEGSGKMDVRLDNLAGPAASDFVTATVLDFARPDIGGAPIGGDDIMKKLTLTYNSSSDATLDFEFDNHALVTI